MFLFRSYVFSFTGLIANLRDWPPQRDLVGHAGCGFSKVDWLLAPFEGTVKPGSRQMSPVLNQSDYRWGNTQSELTHYNRNTFGSYWPIILEMLWPTHLAITIWPILVKSSYYLSKFQSFWYKSPLFIFLDNVCLLNFGGSIVTQRGNLIVKRL